MADDYAKYEAECQKIRKENATLLENFSVWLRRSKLTENTIRKHVGNIDFYLNEFLLYEDAIHAKDGAGEIGMFLGYWFIRKAMWASPAQIKSNAASLKKFYTYMYEQGLITQEDLTWLKERIKEEMPEWVATMNRYDDPSITDMEDVWGF
jgi:site-specific recombinase XerD